MPNSTRKSTRKAAKTKKAGEAQQENVLEFLSELQEENLRKEASNDTNLEEVMSLNSSLKSQLLALQNKASENNQVDLIGTISKLQSSLDIMSERSLLNMKSAKQLPEILPVAVEDGYSWTREGNKTQFTLLKKLLLEFNRYGFAMEIEDKPMMKSSQEKLDGLIRDRIRCLRIADSTPGGWLTVSKYLASPLSFDEEDDKKLKRAEKAAQEEIKQKAELKKNKNYRFKPYDNNANTSPMNRQGATRWGPSVNNNTDIYRPVQSMGGYRNQNPNRTSTFVESNGNSSKYTKPSDVCFYCGQPGHFTATCQLRKDHNSKKCE